MKHTKLTQLTLTTMITLALLAPAGVTPAAAHSTPNSTSHSTPKADAQEPDSDGDGLSDKLETEGYDADGYGKPEVDYKAMGAEPNHKDLFVEMDYMPGELATEEELDRIVEYDYSLV